MNAAPLDTIDWVIVSPTLGRPTGGGIALFEVANALAAARHGRVRLVHVPVLGTRVRHLGDVYWFDFHPSIEHSFLPELDPDSVPDGDVALYTMRIVAECLASDTTEGRRRFLDSLAERTSPRWLSTLFLQGLSVFAPETEALATGLPGPKVCVGSWMVDELVARGVPRSDIAHIPNGVDPDMFRIESPIETRRPRVCMNFDPFKRGMEGVGALETLRREFGVPSTVFGTLAPDRSLGDGLTFELSPRRALIAERIYNTSSAYLQPSLREGFGLCPVEAMACGCALVTTDNGGSAEYAYDGETALVCGPEPAEMAEALARLVHDDALRTRLAIEGARFVQRFRWSESAARLSVFIRERISTRWGSGRPGTHSD